MDRWVLLLVGIAVWLGVAGIAVLVVNAWADDQQVASFFPIAAAVFIAAIVGEFVTDRAFRGDGGES